jgi:hypothetical protein
LPEAPAASESSPESVAGEQPLSAQPHDTPRSPDRAGASQANPKAVAVGLGALLTAVIVAIALSYGSGSTHPDRAIQGAALPRHQRSTAATPTASTGTDSAANAAPRGPLTHPRRYRAASYSFAYPSGWLVSRGDQPLGSYRETLLESASGAAKVTLDYSPGETLDPASKASQVEAATSNTPGYRRISFGPTTVNGHAAFAWEFMVADADPRRVDLFITTSAGDFALLAHGIDLGRARSAARSIAGALS